MQVRGFCTIACAEPAFLVDADWLAGHIGDENLVVLEVRSHSLLPYPGPGGFSLALAWSYAAHPCAAPCGPASDELAARGCRFTLV